MDKNGLYGKVKTGLRLALAVTGAVCAWRSLLRVEPNAGQLCLGGGIVTLAVWLFYAGKGTAGKLYKALLLFILAGFAWAQNLWLESAWQGGILLLEPMVERLNVRHNINLVLPEVVGAGAEELTFALLLFLLPQLLLLCYAVVRRRAGIAGAVYLLPVLVSGFSQSFPDMFSIVCMMLTLAILFTSAHFKENSRQEDRAVLANLALTAVILSAAYGLLLPPMDCVYENMKEARGRVSFVVNGKMIPGLRNIWDWRGIFRDGTIDGELSQENGFAYTQAEFFEVTVDECPQTSVYLRGFVGAAYTGDAWEAEEAGRLGQYYQEHGFTPPQDYAEFVNYTHEILRLCQPEGSQPCVMTVRAMQGDNDYSLYPYGAKLQEDGTANADGSMVKQSNDDISEYYPLWAYNEESAAADEIFELYQLVSERAQYSQYVHDSYLDYPEDLLPRFTAWLEGMELTGDSVFQTAYNVVDMLGQSAVYNLNVQACPQDRDFVEYFILEQREGYCAHFASAAVLMFRRLGIPARYATGYCASPGEFQKNGDGTYTAVIRDRQAHAWAEIYLDKLGWVPVEVTPSDIAFLQDNRMEMLQQIEGAAGETVPGLFSDEEDEPDETMDEEEDDMDEEEEDEEEEDEEDEDETDDGDSPSDLEAAEAAKRRRVFWQAAGVLAAMGILLWLAAVCHRYRKRKAYQSMPPEEQVCEQYRRVIWVMLRTGADRRIVEDREALAEGLGRLDAENSEEEIDAYLREVEECTFGNHPPDEHRRQEAETLSRRFRRQLYARLPVWKRYIIRYLQEWETHADNRAEQGKL